VLEVLDELMSNALDFHFLEPFVFYEDSIRVKEVLSKPKLKQGKAEALSFMKPIERKVFEPRINILAKLTP
jgi:hypothetical protein